MPVYIDNSAHNFGNMIMCHMIADTPEELKAMALGIGVQLKWFQNNGSTPHFDIAKSKRALAIQEGAVVLERKEFVAKIRAIRKTWPVTVDGLWKLFV